MFDVTLMINNSIAICNSGAEGSDLSRLCD